MADILSGNLWENYKEKLGYIESSNRYEIKGGTNDHYDGKYQFGKIAKKDIGLGHSIKEREAFRKDPAAQEKALLDLSKLNYKRLLQNPKFAEMSTDQQMGVLAYAHNQGAGGAKKWLNTGKVGKDGFGTLGTKYYSAFSDKSPFDFRGVEESLRPQLRPTDLDTTRAATNFVSLPAVAVPPVQSKIPPTYVPPVTHVTGTQQINPNDVDTAVREALLPSAGFPSPTTVSHIRQGFNQGTAEVPQVAGYNDGTESVSWLDSLRSIFDRVPSGEELRDTARRAREETYNPAPEVNTGVPLQVNDVNLLPPALPPQASAIEKGYVPTQMGATELNLPKFINANSNVPTAPQAVPVIGRNMDVAMGDDGRPRIPAMHLSDPLLNAAMDYNPGGVYSRDGQEVKYTQTEAFPAPVIPASQENIRLANEIRIVSDELSITPPGRMYDRVQVQLNELKRQQAALGETTVPTVLSPSNYPPISEVEIDGDEVYSGRGDLGMPKDPALVTESSVAAPKTKEDVEAQIIAKDVARNIDIENEADLKKKSDEAIQNSGLGIDSLKGLGSKLLEIFDMESSDVTKAIGLYLLSRATGASHGGSMRWAGGTVLNQVETRTAAENKTKAEVAKTEATSKVLLASGYTPESVAAWSATGIAGTLDKPGPDYTQKQLRDKYAEILAGNKFTPESLKAAFGTVPGQFNPGFLTLKGGNGKTNAENSQLLIKDLRSNFENIIKEAFEGNEEQGAIFLSDMMTSAETHWVSSGIPIGDEAVGANIKRVTSLAMEAAMADSKRGTTTVKDITPYIKNMSLDEYAQSGTDSIWAIGSTSKVDSSKVAVLRKDMYSKSGGDTEVMKGAFLSAVDEFEDLTPDQKARLKPGKGENKFYVYLREKLAGLQ